MTSPLGHLGRYVALTRNSMDESAIATAEEINPCDDLDGRIARDHFLGKSHEDAVRTFADGFDIYATDLLHMGPIAFRFYFRAAVEFARSINTSNKDFDYVSATMLMIMKERFENEGTHSQSVHQLMLEYSETLQKQLTETELDPIYEFLPIELSAFIDRTRSRND